MNGHREFDRLRPKGANNGSEQSHSITVSAGAISALQVFRAGETSALRRAIRR